MLKHFGINGTDGLDSELYAEYCAKALEMFRLIQKHAGRVENYLQPQQVEGDLQHRRYGVGAVGGKP